MEIVEQIITELGLWKPQRQGLRNLYSLLSMINLSDSLADIKASLPRVSFDTQFPSFTFDMATGTGKTKLMAACILYLFRKGISKDFFILAPGDTIYRKLTDDFTKGYEKFVFSGALELPDFQLITGEDYDRQDPTTLLEKDSFNVFVFNIQKIWKPEFKFYSFKETLGASFGDLIKGLKDLAVLMDESHHYRGEQSFRAVNELSPILGLEFTATPSFTGNVIYSYSLGDAVNDGLIKRLRAVIRKNDRSYEDELDDLKLVDGLEIHRRKRVYLATYCKNHDRPVIRPIAFISTKNIAHGKAVQGKIESNKFMNGEFKGKTLFVHSGSEDEQIETLMNLEKPGNTTEVVIHVNKLKEGWDVRPIYTIIPIRASISEILVEQTLGRGVRLPFANLTKEDMATDPEAFTLDVITYKLKGDNYKDVITAANKGNIVVKDYDEDLDKGRSLVSFEVKPTRPKLGIQVPNIEGDVSVTGKLEYFEATPSHPDFKKIQPETVGLDIVTEKVEKIGGATTTIIEDQVSFLVSKLINEIDELDYHDQDVLEKIVARYLTKATGSMNCKQWEELLRMHRSTIYADIGAQIQQKINDSIKVRHRILVKEPFQFREYSASVYEENGVIHKDAIADEEITRTIVGGYGKSIYSENAFDSKQEKWFADILDNKKEKDVLRWVRNPKQVAIKYRYGRYFPDFMIQTRDGCLIVEIKSAADVKDPAVLEKAKEAIKWCRLASRETGVQWDYKLIPHDKVFKNDSFEAVMSNAVKLTDD